MFGIIGNKEKISFGGHLIRNFIESNDVSIINNYSKCTGGPWTWVDRQDSSRKVLWIL